MLVFGAEHPYGRPRTGLPTTVKATTRDDLARFHETYWKPGGAALIFAGDITLAEATEAARQSFGKWAGGAPPKVTIPAPQPVGAGKVFLIDKQDAAQTVVAQLLAAPPRKTDDYYSLTSRRGVGRRLQTASTSMREEKVFLRGLLTTACIHKRLWRSIGACKHKTKNHLRNSQNSAGCRGRNRLPKRTRTPAANLVRGYAQTSRRSPIRRSDRHLWASACRAPNCNASR